MTNVNILGFLNTIYLTFILGVAVLAVLYSLVFHYRAKNILTELSLNIPVTKAALSFLITTVIFTHLGILFMCFNQFSVFDGHHISFLLGGVGLEFSPQAYFLQQISSFFLLLFMLGLIALDIRITAVELVMFSFLNFFLSFLCFCADFLTFFFFF